MDSADPPTRGTDWEAVFEDANTGLIPLVSSAATPAKLRAVSMLIVEQLFLRDSDADRRADYRAALERIFAPGSSAPAGRPVAELIPLVAEFLRAIKQERIARAGGRRPADAASPADASDTGETTEEIFAAVFRSYVRVRFDVLTSGLDGTVPGTGKLPFILSAAFAARFIECLDRHFLARLTRENRGLLIRAETQAPDAKAAYLETQMNDQKFRAVFVKTWTDIWKELTQAKALPPRPAKKSQSLLAKIFDKSAKQPAWLREMTLAEWNAAAAAAKQAKRIWAEIIEDTGAYLCPTDADNRLLMNILGRTPGSLQKQIASIAQIVVQGGSRETFVAYQNGRDIDLALLVVSYRHPDSMLGEGGFVFRMLSAYPEAFRRERFPLVSRYFFDAAVPAPGDGAA